MQDQTGQFAYTQLLNFGSARLRIFSSETILGAGQYRER